MQGIVLQRGRKVKIPCMAKVSLISTLALWCSDSLPASRSCRQKNGGITEPAAWTRMAWTPGHTRTLRARGFHVRSEETQTFAEARAQPFGRPGTTTAIEGRVLLEGPRTVWIPTPPLCVRVWTVLLLQGWLDALRTLVDYAKIIHTNQHSEDNR